jgi:serine/threonine protein kinase
LQRAKESDKNELRKNLVVEIDSSKLTVQEQIGKGAFGNVYRAKYEKKNVVLKILVAKEQMKKEGTRGSDETAANTKESLSEDLKYEATMLFKAQVNGVVKLIAFAESRDPPCIITEYLPNKSLEYEFKIFEERGDIDSIFHPENEHNLIGNDVSDPVLLQTVRLARDIAGILARVHEKGIVHLDVAARNILLDLKKRPKLADFGCAAPEADMKEMYDLCDRYKEDLDEKVETEKDEDFPRKYKMYRHARPAKWMPHWAVADTPRIDRHTDIYSFGCLMYEMLVHIPPHATLSDSEVLKNKKSKPFNPSLPGNVDHRYKRIMTWCWEEYSNQPKDMSEVAAALSDLHSELATESISDLQADIGYMEFREVRRKPGIYHSKSYSTSMNAFSQMKRSTPARSRASSNRIQLYFDNVELNEGSTFLCRLAEYANEGYDKNRFETALNCALGLRDHQSIALSMLCIRIDSNPEQIQMVAKCLEYLYKLAEDQHGSTNEEEEFLWLCSTILIVVREIAQVSRDVQLELKSKVINGALLALSSLLANRTISNNDSDEINSFESDLCSLISDAIEKYSSGDDIMKNVAIAVSSFSGLSQLILYKLHSSGTVAGLLAALSEYKADFEMALKIVQAISCFPIQFLLECNQFENRKGSKNSSLSESENRAAVYHSLFGIVRGCSRPSTSSRTETSSTEGLTVTLLETCLQSLFKMCESGINEKTKINALLLSCTTDDIETLFQAIKFFPNNFRIQEGAIGLLAHLLSTGFNNVVNRKVNNNRSDSQGKATIPPVTNSEQRLSKYLSLDPNLTYLLNAMEKFKIKDKSSLGIATAAEGFRPTGIYGSDNYGYSSQRGKKPVSGMTVSRLQAAAGESWSNEDEGNDERDFELDDTGEPITAAALQRSVAMIVGIACSSRKHGRQVQNSLVQSKYNENILAAFKNFCRDVTLVRFGCQALFCTARCHDQHQQNLKSLTIFKHLLAVLSRHQSMWDVVDAVVCAFMGLLEPPKEVGVLPEAKIEEIKYKLGLPEDKAITTVADRKRFQEEEAKELLLHKKRFVGYSTAEFLTTTQVLFLGPDLAVMSLLQLLAVRVASFAVREECHTLVTNFLKLVSCIGYWLPNNSKGWNPDKMFVDLSILRRNFLARFLLKVAVDKIVSDIEGTPSSFKEGKVGAGIASIEDFGKPVSLVEYTLKVMNMHKNSVGVISSGMAVMVSILRRCLTKDELIIGNEIKSYQDPKSLISLHRATLVETLTPFCEYACKHQEPNPILIRYSLWLLIIFISEKGDESTNAAAQIASDLSINGLIEWSVAVALNYVGYYSLQVLCVHFLYWMEYHNMLRSKPKERLQEILEIARNNENSQIENFLELAEEGHETYLVSEEKHFFGDLRIISQKLNRAVNSILFSTTNKYEGSTPTASDSFKSTKTTDKPQYYNNSSSLGSDDEFEFLQIDKELEVGAAFIKSVPLNVREWTSSNAFDWFREVFPKEKEK